MKKGIIFKVSKTATNFFIFITSYFKEDFFMLKSFIMSKKVIATLIILIVSMGTAYAGTVYDIDTGEPRDTTILKTLTYSSSWNKGLAAKFIYYEAHKITDIKGYFSTSKGGWLTSVIYTGGEDEPDTSSEMSFRFYIPQNSKGWYGPTITYLNLSAGTYWIAFEVRDGDNFDGGMTMDPPNPLKGCSTRHLPYYSSTTGAWGVKIGSEAETQEEDDWLWGYTWDTSENTYLTDSYVSLYSLNGTLESTFYTGTDSAYFYFYKPKGLYYIKAYEANHGYTLKELVTVPTDKKIINFP
ncbi:MAG: hypothetical protein GY749_29590 [Desulfobacteraceae bacterium]|nr:hypothetical protein [Desulfobacteraceae bacterium]